MIRKILLCSAGVYIYMIFAFLQMDLYLKNTSDYAVGNALTIGKKDNNIDTLFHGQRHLAEIEYPLTVQMTTKSLDLEIDIQNCNAVRRAEKCPRACQQHNKTDNGEYEKVRKDALQHNGEENGLNDDSKCQLKELVKNCRLFKELHQYNIVPVTHEERSFPLAFGMKMHTLPEQAEQILRVIYRSHNIYCIHVDRRSDSETFEVIKDIGKCFDNIIMIEDREAMIYSSYAHVTSDIKCMQAVSNTNIPWKYYINLSAQEFPLKTNLEMITILQFFHGINDIETYDQPVDQIWKIENKFGIYGNSLAQESPKSKFKYNMKISKGNPFGLFSREFVDFALRDDVAQGIVHWFNDTYGPEENVWATLVTLPWAPGGYPVEVRHMISTFVSRAMIFAGDSQQCHGRIVRGYCQFGCGDLPWLKSRPEFFASKFDWEHDKDALDCLSSWYFSKAANLKPEIVNINWTFYNRLPHVKYHRKLKQTLQPGPTREELKKAWLLKNSR